MPRILIVDDEKDVVELLRNYFNLCGYDVLSAYDGKKALEKISQKPDIILLDVNMPKLSGLEVCKKIREFVSCPILFLTANDDDIDKIKGFSAGGDDYIGAVDKLRKSSTFMLKYGIIEVQKAR